MSISEAFSGTRYNISNARKLQFCKQSFEIIQGQIAFKNTVQCVSKLLYSCCTLCFSVQSGHILARAASADSAILDKYARGSLERVQNVPEGDGDGLKIVDHGFFFCLKLLLIMKKHSFDV